VSAVLVVHDGAPWLGESIDALVAQTRLPDRLVVVDLDSSDDSLAILRGHEMLRDAAPDLAILTAPGGTSFGEAVRRALEHSDLERTPDEHPERTEWLWLLHDDSAPAATALQRLLEAVGRSPSVGVAGPKVIQWDNPRNLVEVGHQLTRSGRRIAAPAPGEPDQGQYDTRSDVLAVGTCGMLVRRDAFEDIGGFDPVFAGPGGALDFGWRAQLAGATLHFEPGAVVHRRWPSTFPGLARRQARYASSAPRLYRDYARHGMQPSPPVRALGDWVVLALRSPELALPRHRGPWCMRVGHRAGRLAGSARWRTAYL